MTLLWIDGFESERNSTSLAERYSSILDLPSSPLVAEVGYSGGLALPGNEVNAVPVNSMRLRTPSLSPSSTEGVVGFRLNATLPYESLPLIAFLDAATNHQIGLHLIQTDHDADAGYHLQIRRGSEILLTTEAFYETGEWFYVEFRAIIDPNKDNGEVEIRVENTPIAILGNIRTAATTAAGWDRVEIRPLFDSGGEVLLDDLYILDGGAQEPNAFIGPRVVDSLFPEDDDDYQAFTPIYNVGLPSLFPTPHFDAVDDGRTGDHDSDDTYVEHTTPSVEAIELFAFDPSRRVRGSIDALQAAADIHQTTFPGSNIQQGGRNEDDFWWGASFTPVAGYNRYWGLATYDPSSSLDWTKRSVENSRFGIRKTGP